MAELADSRVLFPTPTESDDPAPELRPERLRETTHPEAERLEELQEKDQTASPKSWESVPSLIRQTIAPARDATLLEPAQELKVGTSLEPLQEWEGVVEWVDSRRATFGARLTDMTEVGDDEIGEFAFDEISEDDLQLVVAGAVFYWTIAREVNAVGRRRHTSMIRFRRLPAFRAQRAQEVQQRADWLAERLGIGQGDPASAAGD